MSRYGMTLTLLTSGLAKAVAEDENEGFNLSASMFGPNISEWLKQTAEAVSEQSRPVPATIPASPER